jgi:c(7)-type cytochrome triheme protein
MQLFEPRAGANTVTMRMIKEGQACGQCHNGRDAFAATIGTCQRCHVPPPAAPAPTGTE